MICLMELPESCRCSSSSQKSKVHRREDDCREMENQTGDDECRAFTDEMTSSLGLTTKKALTILRDQLSALLEGHQKERKKVTSWKEVWRSSFLYHGNRCSCFHWPGASLMLLAVLLLLCCYGSQPQGR
ncbi:Kiaa0195 [Columba guinea]|nr:Kiaa0195 [Columba guinea]